MDTHQTIKRSITILNVSTKLFYSTELHSLRIDWLPKNIEPVIYNAVNIVFILYNITQLDGLWAKLCRLQISSQTKTNYELQNTNSIFIFGFCQMSCHFHLPFPLATSYGTSALGLLPFSKTGVCLLMLEVASLPPIPGFLSHGLGHNMLSDRRTKDHKIKNKGS